ncbi:MAG: helix-turn-helix domain-containing protein [Calditrichaeota bacterium]|nr:helix-turn-helix domain-containing protein [Calditrichota bacterium]
MSTPVKLRPITSHEGNALLRVVRRSPDPIARRRAAVILGAATKMTVPDIARTQHIHPTHVRKILHAFNAEGLASLGARYGKGRPRIFDDAIRRRIADVVLTPPHQLGLPFGVWSLPKLRDYVIAQQIVPTVAIATLRTILIEAGISLQRTKTWKQSTDPDYARKKSGSSSATKKRKRVAGR